MGDSVLFRNGVDYVRFCEGHGECLLHFEGLTIKDLPSIFQLKQNLSKK